MRGRTVLKIAAAGAVAVVVAAAGVIASIDPNQYKGLIVAKVKEATGRDLVLDGDLEMVIGLTPSVRVAGARFANAPWASDPNMLAVEEFEAQVALLPALTGELQVKRLVLNGVAIFLETDAKGRANWTFAEKGAPATPGGDEQALTLPTLEEVLIEDARLVLKEDGDVLQTFGLERLTLSADGADAPLNLAAKGSYNAMPFDVQGVLGPLARLGATDGAPYPVALKGETGGVTFSADGGLADPLAGRGVDMGVTVSAADLSGLAPVTGELPALPPVEIKGRLKGGGAAWALSDMTLKAGASTMAGGVAVTTGKARPEVKASLQAAVLDLGDLLGKEESGATGGAGGSSVPRDRVFSADPLPLEHFLAANAVFDLEVARLVLPDGVVLEGVGAKGALRDGRLTLDPAQGRLGDGIVKATVEADASSGKALAVKAAISGDKVVLGKVFADMARSDLVAEAPTDATASLTARGSSLAGLMGSLDGTLRISVGPGKVNRAVIDWAGADVINQLTDTLDPTAEKREYADLVCAAVNLRARDGVIEYDRAIALETSRMSVVSSGAIDLGAEKIDVAVRPYPKGGVGISAGRLAEMVRLQGSLADPKVVADVAGVARTAVSVVGALATGGASLVAEGLMSHASADPAPCATALGGKAPAAQPQPQSQPSSGPLDTSKQAIEDVGQGLTRGLNQLFGR